jgi:undecaprenyl-diphosphatase
LGIIQGLTEFLPVSSSGQLVIAEHFFGLEIAEESMKNFDIFLHAGTLLALFIIFRRDILNILSCKKEGKNLLILLVIGTIPAGLFGVFGADFISSFRSPQAVAFFLGFTAFIFLLAERFPYKKIHTEVNAKNAIFIGLFQCLALFAGISRSGMTISGGLFQGIKREASARFSFLLAMPIITGATILSLFNINFDISLNIILAGFFSSFVFSYFCAKTLLAIFNKLSLSYFSIFLFIESALILLLI